VLAALGLFAAAALLSAIGSVVAFYGRQLALQLVAVLRLGLAPQRSQASSAAARRWLGRRDWR
jgi:hypothetical protein